MYIISLMQLYHTLYLPHFFHAGQRCGPWSVYRRQTAIITSPQYPIPYRPSESCLWQIAVTPGYDLILTVLNIDINCFGDNLQISGIEGTSSFPITTLSTEGAFIIRGISTVLIIFTSHNSTESNTGFVIRYEQIPSS